MAYDPNDPADKAIVDALIAAAVEDVRQEHEAEVTRLNTKNTELLGKLAKARKATDGDNSEEITRIENELDEVRHKLSKAESDLREANRKAKAAETERDAARQTAETESTFSREMMVESGLTSALNEASVAPQFFEATKALLGKGVVIKEVDGKRQAFVNDKPVSEYVKDWAASDAGKPFITAPANGGSGANNAPAHGGSKPLNEMTEAERTEMARTNPAGFDQLVAASKTQQAA